MLIGNLLVIGLIATILGGASWKVISDKKKGIVCAGCPHAPNGKKPANCSCND